MNNNDPPKRGKKPKLPRGWTAREIRRVLEYYENQTDEEPVAEHEAADQTMMSVPTESVPEVRKLIARRRGA